MELPVTTTVSVSNDSAALACILEILPGDPHSFYLESDDALEYLICHDPSSSTLLTPVVAFDTELCSERDSNSNPELYFLDYDGGQLTKGCGDPGSGYKPREVHTFQRFC